MKLQTLKGFKDYLPKEKRARNYVADVIRKQFERFGFEPLETPTLEYASLLLGKYGDEAEKLLYHFEDNGGRQVALRYDQTVPTARVLSQYQSELPRAFRRYQIQNVFRADKPQAGRYREFVQCDADIFAPASTLADAELLAVYAAIYQALGITDMSIADYDRATLISTLQAFATETVSVLSIIQSIDKLDKLAPAQVLEELVAKGLASEQASSALDAIMQAQASDNLQAIMSQAIALGLPARWLVFSPTLARGLDYYTGLIFEGKIDGYAVGSVGGGGRYDNLIKSLGGIDMPAVGFGIGFDRTVEALTAKNLLPNFTSTSSVMVTVYSPDYVANSIAAVTALRQAQIDCEVYPSSDTKLVKQLKTANQKNIPFVIVIGPEEAEKEVVSLKNMQTGEQSLLTIDEVINQYHA